jgi:hypothetical protein
VKSACGRHSRCSLHAACVVINIDLPGGGTTTLGGAGAGGAGGGTIGATDTGAKTAGAGGGEGLICLG